MEEPLTFLGSVELKDTRIAAPSGQVSPKALQLLLSNPSTFTFLQFGDMMTNIVVVQFSDFVQTSRDKRYNLTCLFRGPGEAVVTSSYMTAK